MAGQQAKRKRLGKGKKKTWQYTDIAEIEDFLEDQNIQRRTGGLAAEKKDDQLFFVDTAIVPEKQESDKKSSIRRRREPKPLACHANLLPDPHTIPAKVKRNVKSQKKKVVENQKLSAKQQLALEQRKEADKKRVKKILKRKHRSLVNFDLWGNAHSDEEDSKKFKDADNHFLTITKKRRVKLPRKHYLEKLSEVAAVEVPLPGTSYNPSYDDHQDLLKKATEVEIKKEKEEKKLKRALDSKFPKKSQAPTQATYLAEMSAGLEPAELDFDEGVEDEDILSLNPAVRREDKKTQTQRNKDKLKKQKEKEALLKKKEKTSKHEVFRLKSIKKDIKKMEYVAAQRKALKEQRLKNRKFQTKKLGSTRFEEAELDLKLSSELQSSLRLLKPEGHLLEDRFKSFQKRNMLEVRDRAVPKRRYKPKRFEKKGHKEITS